MLRNGGSFRIAWALLALAPSLTACAHDAVEPTQPLLAESAHFVMVPSASESTQAELDEGVQRAEALFSKLAALVGPERTPDRKIHVFLEGDYKGRGPHVDANGVHLFRFSKAEGGYWALMAHELVHAFRAHWFTAHAAQNWPTYRFFDEGFAEFAAQTIDPHKQGFPFFGFPEDVVVGHWVTTDRHVPPAILRQRHGDLNRLCELQAYPERASWFRFVDETYGRKALLNLAYPDVEPTSSVVKTLLGVSLPEIDTAWERRIRARFAAIPDAAETARAYRDRTSWAHICIKGVDF